MGGCACLYRPFILTPLRCGKTSLQVRCCECAASKHLGVDPLEDSMCLVGWLGTVQCGFNPIQAAGKGSREESWLVKT